MRLTGFRRRPSTTPGAGQADRPGRPAASDDNGDHDDPPAAAGGSSRTHPAGWRPRWAAPLAALALALLGGGALAVDAALPVTPEREPVGGNLPVNAGATDPGDLSAHNSPTLARNPTEQGNLVVANRIDKPRFSCALHVSTDGGAGFAQTPLPIPEQAAEPKCYAPDVAFGPQGKLYVLFVTLKGTGNRPEQVWLATSHDGGETLSSPQRVLGSLAFQVGLTADPHQQGRLYLTWLQADTTATLSFPETGYPINVAVSDDGGDSWSDPARISGPDRARVLAPTAAVGPDGAVHVVYLDLEDDRLDWSGAHRGRGGPAYDGTWTLVHARSPDGGQSWTEAPIGQVRPFQRIIPFLPGFPALAVDEATGRLYVAFHGARHDDADVWLWASEDDGDAWRGPERVNDTPSGDGTAQYLPQVDVAPTGRVDVVYYDRRDDDDNVMNAVSLQSSVDGGRTFTPTLTLSDQAFDSRIGFGSGRDLADLGARLALLSDAQRAMAIWTDTRAGRPVTGKQDLVRQVVAFSDPPTLPDWAELGLRYAGLAALAAAAVTAAVWLRCRSPRSPWGRRRRQLS